MQNSFPRFPLLAAVAIAAFAALPARALVEAGPIVNPDNGHSYYLLSINTWASAELEAQTLGGHLVTISDATENAWVWSTFAPLGGAPFWIGASDVAQEGYFAWSSGEPYWYAAWWYDGGEPNNAGGVEHWAEINNALWNDTDGFGPNNGIVEVEDEPLLRFVESELLPPVPNPPDTAFVDGLAVSNDGAHVYATWNVGVGTDRILVYERASDGSLTLIDSPEAPGNPGPMALSADGSALFVAGSNGEIEAWRRDAETGLVTFADQVYDGDPGATLLQLPTGIAVSPNGENVYVISYENAVTSFAWNEVAGELTVIDTDLSNATGVPFRAPQSVEVTPDGVFVLVTSQLDRSLVVFARNAVDGTIGVAQQLVEDVGGVDGLGSPSQVLAMPAAEGSSVYVTGTEGKIGFFTALPSGPFSGVAFVEAKPVGVGAGWLAPSPIGDALYMADGYRAGAHAIDRDPATGALGGLFDSIYASDPGVDGLLTPRRITASPDGANVYVASFEDITVLATPEPGAVAIGIAALLALGGMAKGRGRRRSRTGIAVLVALALAPTAQAIVVTPTQNTTALINALLGAGGTGIVVTNVTLLGHTQESFEAPGTFENSSGTYTNASGTYGIGSGVVLSTGAVENYGDGPNDADDTQTVFYTISPFFFGIPATPAQELLLDPITTVGEDTFDHFDVTELIVTFNMQPGVSYVAFNVVFGSEEYPEYVEVGYFDGFGMFLNGANVAFVNAQPVNITHPAMAAIAGTELDGVLAPGNNPLLTFGGPVNQTGNTLRFIIGDRQDPILDSTVYLSGLKGSVPEPGSTALALAALGALGLAARSRRIS